MNYDDDLVPLETVQRGRAEEASRLRLRPLDIYDLVALNIPERGMVLEPILPKKGLVMIYGPRGTGKTQLACGICYAVATGTELLKWRAVKRRKILHIDGEMPAAVLRERYTQIMAGGLIRPEPGMLNILAADLLEEGVGNLACPKIQAELDRWLEGIELLVLDNLSSLTAVIRDNDAESWNPIQQWLLKLRRRGISVLIIHHAGKNGNQRGTSRREDVIDTSISLRRPSDYTAMEGARFEIHFEKARGLYGDAVKPFEAKLEIRDGATSWTIKELQDVVLTRVEALLEEGYSVREIADETGFSKSKVQRLRDKINGDQHV